MRTITSIPAQNTSILSSERNSVTPDLNRQFIPPWIVERLDSIQRMTTEQHTRLRTDLTDDMDDFRGEIRTDLRMIRDALSAITLQLNTVQTERRIEGQIAGKRSGWIALYASAGLTVFVELIKTILPLLRRP